MAGTSLKRKARRNKAKAKQKNQRIKLITFKPLPKKVDIEGIKSSFKKPARVEEHVKEEPVASKEVIQEEAKVAKTIKEEKPEGQKTATGEGKKSKTQKSKIRETTVDKTDKDGKRGAEKKSGNKEN